MAKILKVILGFAEGWNAILLQILQTMSFIKVLVNVLLGTRAHDFNGSHRLHKEEWNFLWVTKRKKKCLKDNIFTIRRLKLLCEFVCAVVRSTPEILKLKCLIQWNQGVSLQSGKMFQTEPGWKVNLKALPGFLPRDVFTWRLLLSDFFWS